MIKPTVVVDLKPRVRLENIPTVVKIGYRSADELLSAITYVYLGAFCMIVSFEKRQPNHIHNHFRSILLYRYGNSSMRIYIFFVAT